MFYKYLIKPIFFRFDPEFIHDLFTNVGELLGRSAFGRGLVRFFCGYKNPVLRSTVLGITFENPVGLAAGFDKNVRLTDIMPEVGFGFMEAGAITRFASPGNSGRRLLRLPKDRSLVVYFGLNNIGADAILEKLNRIKFRIPVGLNIAKTNRADVKGERSVEDYAYTYRTLSRYFSYVTLNVSCPNTQDGCTFQDPKLFEALLKKISQEKKSLPVFVKISNHLAYPEVDTLLGIIRKYTVVDGIIVANLSKDRNQLKLRSSPALLQKLPLGGISGAPVRERSTELIRYIYNKTGGKYPIIGVGGIFTAEDAYKKIKAGASLVQIITGLIYEGPTVVKRINRGLVRLLKSDGYKNITEAVGIKA